MFLTSSVIFDVLAISAIIFANFIGMYFVGVLVCNFFSTKQQERERILIESIVDSVKREDSRRR